MTTRPISFTEYNRWQAACVQGPGEGVTNGDTFYLGLRSYTQPYPCPNGMETRNDNPCDVPAWRRRIDKAKKDSAAWSQTIRVREIAAEIPPEEILKDLEIVRTWANSLK